MKENKLQNIDDRLSMVVVTKIGYEFINNEFDFNKSYKENFFNFFNKITMANWKKWKDKLLDQDGDVGPTEIEGRMKTKYEIIDLHASLIHAGTTGPIYRTAIKAVAISELAATEYRLGIIDSEEFIYALYLAKLLGAHPKNHMKKMGLEYFQKIISDYNRIIGLVEYPVTDLEVFNEDSMWTFSIFFKAFPDIVKFHNTFHISKGKFAYEMFFGLKDDQDNLKIMFEYLDLKNYKGDR